MPVQQCPSIYTRRVVVGDELIVSEVPCTYLYGHDPQPRHSFWALRDADLAETRRMAEQARASARSAPATVQDLVAGVEAGTFDTHLELILAAAHDRKRTRRGVAGFPRTANRDFFR